ncbi:MAG: hypothetical protein WDM86_00965 [Rhizomicrobium sp.]
MGYAAPLVTGDVRGFGYAEHLLVWSWRRIAAGQACCPLMMDEFASACGEDGPEVIATYCTFLKALAMAGRRRFAIGAPGCLAVTADERQVLILVAAAQADTPALLEAHLRWIAVPEKRHLLEIATGALARALSTNDLHIALPAQEMPSVCERKLAVA